jgi:tetratricopeptide (TPR) repeat protein
LAIVATVLVILVALAASTFLLALAYEREMAQRKGTEQNTNQAIANLRLALEIVDVIYTRLVSKEVSPSQSNEPAKRVGSEKAAKASEKGDEADQAEEDPEEDAALLQSLLEFYERLAGASKTCPADLLPKISRDGKMEAQATLARQTEGQSESGHSTHGKHQWLQQKVLAFYEGSVEQCSSDRTFWPEIGKAYGRIGDIRAHFGQMEQSHFAYRAACMVWRSLVKEMPSVPEYRKEFDDLVRYRFTESLVFQVHRERDDFERVLATLDDAVTLCPDLAIAYYMRGVVYSQRGRYSVGCSDMLKYIDLQPLNALAYKDVADCFYAQRQDDTALVFHNEALDLQLRDAAYYHTPDIVYDHNEYDRALAACSKEVERNPEDTTAYASRAAFYEDYEQYDLALADLNKALDLANPNDALDLALADHSIALQLASDCAALYHNRALVYRARQEYDLALADLNRALAFMREYVWIYVSRGCVHLDRAQYDLALESLNRALELDAKNALAYTSRGLVYRGRKQYDLALADLNKALELDPEDSATYSDRGTVYTDRREYELALADLNRAVELEPENSAAYRNRGKVYYAMKRYDAALAELKTAIEVNVEKAALTRFAASLKHHGEHGYDLFFLALAYCQLGEKDEARQWYQKAVDWMEHNKPEEEGLGRFRDEAAKRMKAKEKEQSVG